MDPCAASLKRKTRLAAGLFCREENTKGPSLCAREHKRTVPVCCRDQMFSVTVPSSLYTTASTSLVRASMAAK